MEGLKIMSLRLSKRSAKAGFFDTIKTEVRIC